MACCLFGVKPLAEPMLSNYQLHNKEQILGKMQSKYKHFMQERAFENVACKTSAVLFTPLCVKHILLLKQKMPICIDSV